MKLSTPVEITPLEQKIGYNDKITFLGSCFADEIGRIMQELKFDLLLNPFGVLFNPGSITSSVERLTLAKEFHENDVIKCDERYTTFYHHSSLSEAARNSLIDNLNCRLKQDSEHFRKSNWIVISLGTAWVYRHIERDIIVSNCHKHPDKEFAREFLSIDEISGLLSKAIECHPNKDQTDWIFTVSPIRHKKDGLHNNQLSKSTLLLALDKLQQQYPNVHYFPAYEILLDELRDYRFYAEDMVHPSNTAIKIIWERFTNFVIDPDSIEEMNKIEKENKRLSHKNRF